MNNLVNKMRKIVHIKQYGGDFLKIIQCAEFCRFQSDGYCSLENCGNVNSTKHPCPYYIPKLTNGSNSLLQITNTDKLHADRTIGNMF